MAEEWSLGLQTSVGLVSRPDFDYSSPSWLLLRSPWAALSSDVVISPAASAVWPWLQALPASFASSALSRFPQGSKSRGTAPHQPFHHPTSGSSRAATWPLWVLTVFLLEPGVPGGPGWPLLPCQKNRHRCDSKDTALMSALLNTRLCSREGGCGHTG